MTTPQEARALAERLQEGGRGLPQSNYRDAVNMLTEYADLLERQAQPADDWRKLYLRALNEANGLTNYVEDRPELRHAEKRLAKIEADARDIQARAASAPAAPNLLEWACWRWREEVQDRPLINKSRRTLDDTWRQVIRFAGGEPDALIGPAHDALLPAAPKEPT